MYSKNLSTTTGLYNAKQADKKKKQEEDRKANERIKEKMLSFWEMLPSFNLPAQMLNNIYQIEIKDFFQSGNNLLKYLKFSNNKDRAFCTVFILSYLIRASNAMPTKGDWQKVFKENSANDVPREISEHVIDTIENTQSKDDIEYMFDLMKDSHIVNIPEAESRIMGIFQSSKEKEKGTVAFGGHALSLDSRKIRHEKDHFFLLESHLTDEEKKKRTENAKVLYKSHNVLINNIDKILSEFSPLQVNEIVDDIYKINIGQNDKDPSSIHIVGLLKEHEYLRGTPLAINIIKFLTIEYDLKLKNYDIQQPHAIAKEFTPVFKEYLPVSFLKHASKTRSGLEVKKLYEDLLKTEKDVSNSKKAFQRRKRKTGLEF